MGSASSRDNEADLVVRSVALGPLCLPCPTLRIWNKLKLMIRVWILGWGQFSCLWNVATRGRCGTQLWLMKIPLNLVGLEGSRLPIRSRLCWVSFDNLWFKKVWIYYYYYYYYYHYFVGVLACGFNWVCLILCFYGSNVGFWTGWRSPI